MITLSDGDKGGDHMIAGSMFVIEGSLAEPVSKGIDAEGRLFINPSARWIVVNVEENGHGEQK